MNEEYELYDEESLLPEVVDAPAAQQGQYPWDSNLPFDMALGVYSPEELCNKYAITQQHLDVLTSHPTFRKELQRQTREIAAEGLTFRHKARLQAEQYLLVLDDIVNDPMTPASTRLEAIKYTTKAGDLEPRDKKDSGDNNGVTVQVQINI